MGHRDPGVRKRRSAATLGALAVGCGALAGGVAGAADTAEPSAAGGVTIRVDDTTPRFDPDAVAIATGDTVTWSFEGTSLLHNAAPYVTEFMSGGSMSHRFTEPGTFIFRCQVHDEMGGTITVTGDPVTTPVPTTPASTTTSTTTSTATATATATTPTATPGASWPSAPAAGGGTEGVDHTMPAPALGATADTIAPSVGVLRLRPIHRGARLTLDLSEPASLTITFTRRGSKRILRTFRVQVRAGPRTIVLRSPQLVRGRYVVGLQGRDATGNRSAIRRATLRLRR